MSDPDTRIRFRLPLPFLRLLRLFPCRLLRFLLFRGPVRGWEAAFAGRVGVDEEVEEEVLDRQLVLRGVLLPEVAEDGEHGAGAGLGGLLAGAELAVGPESDGHRVIAARDLLQLPA